MSLRPLFPFYGSKWRAARLYPQPRSLVIEPFAGSAGFSLWHQPDNVLLIDRDPIIVGIWDYLIRATERELARLPDLEVGQNTEALAIPQEAKWLIGFWINRGSATPKNRRTAWSTQTDKSQLVWGERARQRLVQSAPQIRHWKVRLSSYWDAPVTDSASYFIDPPYVKNGRRYRLHDLDYSHIASWARALPGSVTVCEEEGASWLPFRYLDHVHSTLGWSPEYAWLKPRS